MNKLLDLDRIASVLVILIMLLEVAIILRAFLISTALGWGLGLLFHLLDYAIVHIHNQYFRQ